MYSAKTSVAIESMQLAHLPVIMEIERESFSLPWPEHAYRHELTRNDLAHYYVLKAQVPSRPRQPGSAWQRVWQMMTIGTAAESVEIWGYGGFWMIVDEAHISTLAIKKTMRKRGYGQLLLLALLEEARRLGAVMVTLEVRVSNTSAQTLYTKFGFQQAGRRKAYYHDNGEDALILTTPHLESVEYWNLVENNRAKLLEQLPYPNNEQDCTTMM